MRADVRTTAISDIEFLETVRARVERAAAAVNCPQIDRNAEEFQVIWSRLLNELTESIFEDFFTAES